MSALSYADLKAHIGHRIECVGYDEEPLSEPENVAVECIDCYEVILDFDRDDEGRIREAGTAR